MSNKELQFNPTADQMFELEGRGRYNFVRHNEGIDALVKQGRYDEACEARYEAFQLLVDALPEDEAMPLRWEHANSRAAVSVLYGSAVDHFRIGDLEMAMAQLELLLDCDPEDHFEAVNLLALCYVPLFPLLMLCCWKYAQWGKKTLQTLKCLLSPKAVERMKRWRKDMHALLDEALDILKSKK